MRGRRSWRRSPSAHWPEDGVGLTERRQPCSGLRFVGLAILLSSVVLVLLAIQKTLRFQAARITEIADQTSPAFPSPTPASHDVRDLSSPATPNRTRVRHGA